MTLPGTLLCPGSQTDNIIHLSWNLDYLAYISATESITSMYLIHPESYRMRWNNVDVRAIMPFKVTDFGTNRKLMCDFLLVINSNLPPILQRFRDIALEMSKIVTFSTPLWFNFNPPTEGFPWDDLRKIFTRGLQLAKVPNGVETLPKISIAWVGCTNVSTLQTTDDRRQTDGRTTTYGEREHEFTFAKS